MPMEALTIIEPPCRRREERTIRLAPSLRARFCRRREGFPAARRQIISDAARNRPYRRGRACRSGQIARSRRKCESEGVRGCRMNGISVWQLEERFAFHQFRRIPILLETIMRPSERRARRFFRQWHSHFRRERAIWLDFRAQSPAARYSARRSPARMPVPADPERFGIRRPRRQTPVAVLPRDVLRALWNGCKLSRKCCNRQFRRDGKWVIVQDV